MVGDVALAYVATVSPDGLPNLSPIGSLKVLDEHKRACSATSLRPAHAQSHRCGFVDVNVVDVFRRHGYRIRGPAEVSDDPDLIAFVAADLGSFTSLKRPRPHAAPQPCPLHCSAGTRR
jgi:uncharacterized protein